jgi:CheY-like chemotaxis protein
MTIDEATAKAIALELIHSELFDTDEDLVIIDEATIKKWYGWIFFYDTRKFLETGAFGDRMFGNAPIIVEKSDGEATFTGTALPLSHYTRRYAVKRLFLWPHRFLRRCFLARQPSGALRNQSSVPLHYDSRPENSPMLPVILVIEPDKGLRQILARLLKKQRYLVVTAADGEEGLVKASVHLPQLIIVNLFQHGLDGVEVAKQLREDDTTRSIPVLLMLPKSSDQSATDAWLDAADIRYLLLKPIEPKTFLERVSTILLETQEEETGT